MDTMALMDLGGGVGFFGTLFIGGVAGWIAEKLTKADHGILKNIIVGVIGSFIGGWIANLLNIRIAEVFDGWFLGNLLVAVVGAVVLITVYRMIKGDTNR